MFPLLRRRPLIWLALFAWLAQLCLPPAHAAAMAQQNAGLATWCGAFSPALSKKIAALPDEVREILGTGNAHSGAKTDCPQFCTGAGLMPVAATVSLRAAGVETPVPARAERRREQRAPRPPPRGPPQES